MLKTKTTEVSICGIANTNIKRKLKVVAINSYLFYWIREVMNYNNKIISVAI